MALDELDVQLLRVPERVVQPDANLHRTLALLRYVRAALEVELLLLGHLDGHLGAIGMLPGARVHLDIYPVEDVVAVQHRVGLHASHAELVQGGSPVHRIEHLGEQAGAGALIALHLHGIHRKRLLADVAVPLLVVVRLLLACLVGHRASGVAV